MTTISTMEGRRKEGRPDIQILTVTVFRLQHSTEKKTPYIFADLVSVNLLLLLILDQMFVTTMIPKRFVSYLQRPHRWLPKKRIRTISQQKFLLFVELFLSYVINTLVFKFTLYKQMSAQWKYTVF